MKRWLFVLVVWSGACEEPPVVLEPRAGGCFEPEKSDAGAGVSASFVLLPDTQFYACRYPEIFQAQTEWILQAKEAEGVGIVVHTGDVVDDPSSAAQWQVAADAMHVLDGEVPYLMASGNHDIDLSRDEYLSAYFRQEDLLGARRDRFCFRYAERVTDAYALVELRNQRWLFLTLPFAPLDADIAWAGDVLRDHAAVPTVLLTHAYLYSDGLRYDRNDDRDQKYHPDDYGLSDVNDGEDIWRKLVEPNENVKLVLSGHVLPDGTARAESEREDGSVVHEVLTNYQTCEACPCEGVQGGNGYLRVFTLSEDHTTLSVRTYSPYLDASLADSENEFVLEL